jgi:hypothetical protein
MAIWPVSDLYAVPARDLLDYELAEAPPAHAAQLMAQAHDRLHDRGARVGACLIRLPRGAEIVPLA